MLRFADEIELVPFDQPLLLPEGMSPIRHAHQVEAMTPDDSVKAPGVHAHISPFESPLIPLFHPAA